MPFLSIFSRNLHTPSFVTVTGGADRSYTNSFHFTWGPSPGAKPVASVAAFAAQAAASIKRRRTWQLTGGVGFSTEGVVYSWKPEKTWKNMQENTQNISKQDKSKKFRENLLNGIRLEMKFVNWYFGIWICFGIMIGLWWFVNWWLNLMSWSLEKFFWKKWWAMCSCRYLASFRFGLGPWVSLPASMIRPLTTVTDGPIG